MDKEDNFIRPNEKNFMKRMDWKKVEKQVIIAAVFIAVLVVTEIIKANLEDELDNNEDFKKW